MRSDTSILVDQIYEQSGTIQILLEKSQVESPEYKLLQDHLAELWKELENKVRVPQS